MPISYDYPRAPGATGKVSRGFVFRVPPDWFDHLGADGLPVVLLLHGGGNNPDDILDRQIGVTRFFTGADTATEIRIKCVFVAPVGLEPTRHTGGVWENGIGGGALRPVFDDVEFIFAVLDKVEETLIEQFLHIKGTVITKVFDRSRLIVGGFSLGGGMAYRIGAEALAGGSWTLTGLIALSASAGGWLREADRILSPPDVDWPPSLPPTSLFLIHGEEDDIFPARINGVGSAAAAACKDTVDPPVDWEEYCPAYISGMNSGLGVVANNDALMPYPSTVTGEVSNPFGVAPSVLLTKYEWGTSHAVHMYYDPDMGHEYPDVTARWGANAATIAMIDFLEAWAGL